MTAFAIIVHAILPAPVDDLDFDSVLVQIFWVSICGSFIFYNSFYPLCTCVTFLWQRAIGYQTGIVDSNVAVFPLPTYLWTLLFGLTLGYICSILYPIYAAVAKYSLLPVRLVVVTIGLNWIIFNSFIGLIFSGVMPQMLLRSGIDIVVLFITFLAVYPRFQNNKDQ